MRDYAEVHGDGLITADVALKALALLEVDDAGLDPADRQLLLAIIENYKGGPVGVETLAAMTGDERTTIEDMYEPFLMQIGFLERTARGRKVTPKAYTHLGKTPHPDTNQAELI